MDARTAFFEEMVSQWMSQEAELRGVLEGDGQLKFWVRPDAAAEFESLEHRAELAEGMSQLARQKAVSLLLGVMAALDGATRMVDSGVRIDLFDQDGNPLGKDLHADLMDYLVSIGW